jgi:DNA-binding protein H-NS
LKAPEKALKNKLANKRKDVIVQIKELAASIDVTVDVYESGKRSARKGIKVPVKYRHPEDPEKNIDRPRGHANMAASPGKCRS